MRSIQSTAMAAAAALLAVLPLATRHAGAATSSFMTECSAKWKAAKAGGTLPAGMKWPEFVKTVCGHDTSADATASSGAGVNPPAAIDPASNATAPGATPTTTSAATTPTALPADSGGTFMSQCSTSWKKLKAGNGVPAGLTWKQFVKQKCVVDSASASAAAGTTPAESQPTPSSAIKPTQNWRSIAVAKTDKNGKPFSQGQIEAHQRIKECAAEWHEAKANHTLPSGEKWPHFWSTCNTRLKAQS